MSCYHKEVLDRVQQETVEAIADFLHAGGQISQLPELAQEGVELYVKVCEDEQMRQVESLKRGRDGV